MKFPNLERLAYFVFVFGFLITFLIIIIIMACFTMFIKNRLFWGQALLYDVGLWRHKLNVCTYVGLFGNMEREDSLYWASTN